MNYNNNVKANLDNIADNKQLFDCMIKVAAIVTSPIEG